MKSITRKIQIPIWSKFLAQNSQGQWFVYEFPPKLSVDLWDLKNLDGEVEFVYNGEVDGNWQNSLTRIK